jgi:hypothetical protein
MHAVTSIVKIAVVLYSHHKCFTFKFLLNSCISRNSFEDADADFVDDFSRLEICATATLLHG